MFQKIVKKLWPDLDYTSPENDTTAFLIALEMVNRGWSFKVRPHAGQNIIYFSKDNTTFKSIGKSILEGILEAAAFALDIISDPEEILKSKYEAPVAVIRKRGRPRKDAEPV